MTLNPEAVERVALPNEEAAIEAARNYGLGVAAGWTGAMREAFAEVAVKGAKAALDAVAATPPPPAEVGEVVGRLRAIAAEHREEARAACEARTAILSIHTSTAVDWREEAAAHVETANALAQAADLILSLSVRVGELDRRHASAERRARGRLLIIGKLRQFVAGRVAASNKAADDYKVSKPSDPYWERSERCAAHEARYIGEELQRLVKEYDGKRPPDLLEAAEARATALSAEVEGVRAQLGSAARTSSPAAPTCLASREADATREPPKWRTDQPPPFEGDDDGYPTEEWIAALHAHKMDFHAAATFLLTGFLAAVDGISCCCATVTDTEDEIYGEGRRIEFSTGGWSGAEDLIGTMLGQFPVRHFHRKWEAGGHYTFFVPKHFYAPEEGSQHLSSDGEGTKPPEAADPTGLKSDHPLEKGAGS